MAESESESGFSTRRRAGRMLTLGPQIDIACPRGDSMRLLVRFTGRREGKALPAGTDN